MNGSAVWAHRDKLSWGAAGATAIGMVLLVFFAFSGWIEFTPGTSGFSTRGVQDPNDSTRTITRSTPTFTPGAVYYNWASIDTFPYTLPIGGAAILLALAGWTAATSAVRGSYDRARLKRASLLAFAAVGIGFGGAAWPWSRRERSCVRRWNRCGPAMGIGARGAAGAASAFFLKAEDAPLPGPLQRWAASSTSG